MKFSGTLLLEVDKGIIVRKEQEDTAYAMREPPNGTNSVMQLLMGRGKSSVIIPTIAVALADQKQ